MNAFEIFGRYVIDGVDLAIQQINTITTSASASAGSITVLQDSTQAASAALIAAANAAATAAAGAANLGNTSGAAAGDLGTLGAEAAAAAAAAAAAGTAADAAAGDLTTLGGAADTTAGAAGDAGDAAGDAADDIADVADAAADAADDVDTLGDRFQEFGQSVQDAGETMTGFVTGTIGALTAAALEFGSQAGEYGNLVKKIAKDTGISYDALQRQAFAAKSVGIEMETYGETLTEVKKAIGEFDAVQGGAMADFFEQIGPKINVTIDHFKELSGPAALQFYYNSLIDAGAGEQEVIFYMDALGGESVALIPLLAKNGTEMKKLSAEAAKLGLVMSDDLIDAADDVNNILDELGAQTSFAGQRIGVAFLPVLEEMNRIMETFVIPIVNALSEGLTSLGETYNELPLPVRNVIAAIITFIAIVGPILFLIGGFIKVIGILIGSFKILIPLIRLIIGAFNPWVAGITLVVAAVLWLVENYEYLIEKAKEAANWAAKLIGLGPVFENVGVAPQDGGSAIPDEAQASAGSSRAGGGTIIDNRNAIFNNDTGMGIMLGQYGLSTSGGRL